MYYLILFLFLTFLSLVIISAEVSIGLTYLSLTKGNYIWHWNSFLAPAFCSFYVFLYSIFYYINNHSDYDFFMTYIGIMSKIIYK